MDKETMGAIDRAKGTVTAEGYVNIAGQVGLSGMRGACLSSFLMALSGRRS